MPAGDQIDGLVERRDRVGAGEEIVPALPRARAGRSAWRRSEKSVQPRQARLEAGVGQQVLMHGRQRLVRQRIAEVDRRAGEPLPAGLVEHAVVVQRQADESRLRPVGIHHRAPDRVQVELVDVLLPVEDIA